MTNIYLIDSDKETIVDFVKDHGELYNKTNEHFKDKARKEYLWEQFVNCWFESKRTCYGKVMQTKSGQALKMTEHQNWIQDKLGFLRSHMRRNGLSKSSGATASALHSFD